LNILKSQTYVENSGKLNIVLVYIDDIDEWLVTLVLHW